MAKIGIFKKIAALVTVIALVVCFAVTASAVSVSTTTSYLNGNSGDIYVDVNVYGADIVGKDVAYYAYNAAGPVYIDQDYASDASGVFFSFATADTNLNSDVKVGYTGASAATPSQIDGISVRWGADKVKYIPNDVTDATVIFDTDATSIEGIEADFAEVASFNLSNGKLTVTLSDIVSDATNIGLTVTTGAPAVNVELIDAAFLISNGSDDSLETEADTKAGDRKLTVIGKVTNASEFGVIVSENNIAQGYLAEEKYKVIDAQNGKTANGYYAIQIIDDTAEKTYLDDAKTYYVAAYGDDVVSTKIDTVTAVQQTKN